MNTSDRIKADVGKNISPQVISVELHAVDLPEALYNVIRGMAERSVTKLKDLVQPGSPAYEYEKGRAVILIERLMANQLAAELRDHYKKK